MSPTGPEHIAYDGKRRTGELEDKSELRLRAGVRRGSLADRSEGLGLSPFVSEQLGPFLVSGNLPSWLGWLPELHVEGDPAPATAVGAAVPDLVITLPQQHASADADSLPPGCETSQVSRGTTQGHSCAAV